MSLERRTVRPFKGIDEIKGALEGSVLSYGNVQCEAGGSVLVASEFGRRIPRLRWCADDGFEEWQRRVRRGAVAAGFDPALLQLVVTARTSALKSCEMVFAHSVSECHGLSNPIDLSARPDGARPDAFCADSHGAVVDAYVALVRDVNTSAGRSMRPYRVGTWLAHATFRLRCDSESELFRPHPLSDEERRNLKLPSGTVSYTEIDGDLTDALDGGESARFWVDKELLVEIDAGARTSQAEFLQRQLMADFITDVITAFASQTDGEISSYADVADSLVGRGGVSSPV